ncbi:MAG: hypothetical protein LBE56_00805, partial [Tannerella sp.]|nr:hypothetical protein [Tannerella sp.]
MDVVLDGQLRLSFQLTESIEVLRESAYGITYAPQPLSIENEVFIWQHPVMSSSGVSTQVIDMGEFEGEPVFFQSPDNQSFLPFDIFAMSFYLLSRYEEYQPHRKDDYGRFPAAESIAFNNGFLHKPLVDILILKFAQKLRGQFGDALFAEAKAQAAQPQYIATYDIDHAYAYLHKGFVRTAGALAREILRFDIKEVKRRIAVLTGKQKDPFDTYDLIERIEREYALSQSIFFILFTGISQNDRGLNPKNKHFRQLIQRLRKTGKIACHPSFASSSSNDKLSDEISGLSGLLNESISVSRSHFLLLDFPETYQRYMANGIRTDFTMGYP